MQIGTIVSYTKMLRNNKGEVTKTVTLTGKVIMQDMVGKQVVYLLSTGDYRPAEKLTVVELEFDNLVPA